MTTERPDTGKRYQIFGPSSAEKTAQRIRVPFLGRLPIDPEIARLCDAGRVEDDSAETFVSITKDLISRTPEAKRSGFVQTNTVR